MHAVERAVHAAAVTRLRMRMVWALDNATAMMRAYERRKERTCCA